MKVVEHFGGGSEVDFIKTLFFLFHSWYTKFLKLASINKTKLLSASVSRKYCVLFRYRVEFIFPRAEYITFHPDISFSPDQT